jgi:uncharacterized protein YycO
MLRIALLIALLAVSLARAATVPPLRDGDIIFHTSRSSQSIAIQRATGSAYSHMGIVFYRAGKPYVLEAVSTVRYTPLDQWLSRGVGGHYVIKRLVNAAVVLTPETTNRLRMASETFLGHPYDLTFEWSDQRIYCSELVWKAYHRATGVHIGELQQMRDFNLNDPAVQAKLRQRYGSKVPLDEPVISPAAMFASPLLTTVAER